MIKQAFTLIFILFTNILLLAHTVVPHHHHIVEVCIEDSNSHSSCNHQDDENDSNNDNHKDTSHEHCVLKQAFITSSNQLKPEFKIIEKENEFLSFNPPALFYNSNISNFNNKYSFRGNPLFEKGLYDCYTGNNLNFRAPPTI